MKYNNVILMALIAGLALVAQSVHAVDAASELAALKAKYPEALERCSVFEMMHKSREFQEIDATQGRTVEEKDWAGFERVARAGIALKAQPEIWYYNLACALSRQKKIPEALVALEQCVAAGYHDRTHVERDGDMENLRKEKRYEELLELMDFNDKNYTPKETVKIRNGRFMPTDATMECVTREGKECFVAFLEAESNDCPIVYMDRNRPHKDSIHTVMPELGLIEVEYPEEMKKLGQDVGAANLALRQFPSANGGVVPVVAATDVTGSLYRGSSLAADCGLDSPALHRLESLSRYSGVLQVAAAGKDFGVDDYDRYLSNVPMIISYVGGKAEQRFFVKSIVRAIRALPCEVRNDALTNNVLVSVVQKLLRSSQKNVRGTDDYLSGAAHRPAFFADQIDAERMVRIASEMKKLPPTSPFMILKECIGGVPQSVSELEIAGHGVRSLALFNMCKYGSAFAFRGLDRTMQLRFGDGSKTASGNVLWKVLQGDPEKVRVVSKDGFYDVEVDYHPVFEVEDAHGKKVKTCRVDIGFFREKDGDYSLPCIVSVAMPPHDSRTYDSKGRIVEVDYTKPQIDSTNFVAKTFVRGHWRDTYHYAEDGSLCGWTRDLPGYPGSAVEWNADYMAVVERDELGRPSRLARPRIYEWTQDGPVAADDDARRDVYVRARSIMQDNYESDFNRVSWVCEYASTNDFVGEIKEIPYSGYSPRRFNPYADFGTETNGFAYPLSMELDDGWNQYEISKYGTGLTNHGFVNLKRERGKQIPMAMPPKKMMFTTVERRPWRWPDIADVEHSFATNLVKIPDGVYRFRMTNEDGDEWLASISETRRKWNGVMSEVASKRMDEAGFERCSTNELDLALKYAISDEFATNTTLYVSGNDREIVRNRQNAVTGWHVAGDMCLVVKSDGRTGTDRVPGWESRTYSFVRIDTNDVKRIANLVDFGFFPPEDMTKVFLHGYAGTDGDAENDLAVLFYSGAADFYHYREDNVLYFLNNAARNNNSVAMHNLGVFYDNRKDRVRAENHYRLARQIEKHMKYAETFEASFGGTNITGWVGFLEKEVAQEHAEAYVELAFERMNAMKDEEDNPGRRKQLEAEAVMLLNKGAEAGDLMALNVAAGASERIGITNAVGWAQDAVATGFADENACCELANAYRAGLGGLETNAVKVVELLTYAAEALESARARFELGECYMTGYGVEEADPMLALNLQFAAARQGYPPAEAKQGRILVLSGFAAKDDERMQEGIDMLRDAIDKGNLEAMMFMAARHELGDIPLIKKDIKLAVTLYSALAESGDSEAQKKVEALREKQQVD